MIMEDKIFFCKSNQLAKYLINNGCTNINKNNDTYEFIKNEKLIQLINNWSFEKKKYFF